MKHTTPTRHTIRFRRWSRKAYAAFASIGRCVTIGALRKSVADSSLSKQKKTGAAGHAGCCAERVWKGLTPSGETDIGIPLGSDLPLTVETTGLGTSLQVFFQKPLMDSCANANQQEPFILKQRNKIGTDDRSKAAYTLSCTSSGRPCFFFIHT